jgi:hypothetical protein
MIKKFLPILIFLSALSVSGSAAFYSVLGLSKLFAGASTQVIIMAASLEFAKLVVASLLYNYWGKLNVILRSYLMVAVFILMLITSGGIYGYLSSAYQETATKTELMDKTVSLLEIKKNRFEQKRGELLTEKGYLTQNISDLRKSISNPSQVQYIDKSTGQLITTTSSSSRRSLEKELKSTVVEKDSIDVQIGSVTDSLTFVETAILNQNIENETQSELGPLKYLSGITGKPMETVVNWFLLLIIFVFDPLAISMVIAANVAFNKTFEDKLQTTNKNKKLTKKVIDYSVTDDVVSENDENINQPREIVYRKRDL